ncbi:MAG: hypothetical protein NVS9B10_12970 [Nevskia sp.]
MMKYIAMSRIIHAATERRAKEDESSLQRRLGLGLRERLNCRYADTGSGESRPSGGGAAPASR